MYHSVPLQGNGGQNAITFEKQILFLRRYFDFVSPNYVQHSPTTTNKTQILLTLDDGFRNNAEVVAPILRRYRVPALFFVSSRHSTDGQYLWFAYLDGLQKYFAGNGFCFNGEFIDMSPDKRHESIRRLRQTLLNLKPHPSAMYDAIEKELPCLNDFVSPQVLSNHYAGITAEQLGELSTDPLFSVGIHTVDHPFLTKCTREELRHQILSNKAWIEQVGGKPCNVIAYPAGEYNSETLEQCRLLGVAAGYCVTPTANSHREYEIPRIVIYSPSLAVLRIKARWGHALRALGFKIG
jgi:peptidoglycan/xylan/chitin deacetylase (PgdA/CDA1 family)